MRYGILGCVQVRLSGAAVRLASRPRRLLLTMLLVEANRFVPADRLIEELWGAALPADPAGALRTQISRLRASLGPAGTDLATGEGSYRLSVARPHLDALVFEDLVAESGRRQGEDALRLLGQALGLWRGPALGEFADRSFAQPYAARLEEMRLSARERGGELLLTSGRAAEAVAHLERLVVEEPERERSRALLMHALYADGRQTDALAVYQDWRRHLAEDLGLHPSPLLQRVEQEVLQHALPVPAAPPPPRPAPRLPRPVTSFRGREAAVASLCALLGEVRLLTLAGPGGVGKTRLGLETAALLAPRYADGAWFCSLAAVGRHDQVLPAVAATVGLTERSAGRLVDLLAQHLESRQALLVLDGCEHVLDEAAAVAEAVVERTGGVDVLATSRERLGAHGEHVWRVAPLGVTGREPPAVRLFLDRARAVDPSFEPSEEEQALVADICSRLDGLPLAIELAAARTAALGLADLAAGLDRGFRLLTGGRPSTGHHSSLRAVVDWSYQHLPSPERQAFELLSVFAGRFGLDAARGVVAGAGIDADAVTAAVLHLAECSLLDVHPSGATDRYRMLDTLRAYGRERLEERGALADARDRHASWALDLAAQAARGLDTAAERRWSDELDRRLDDLREAHRWLLDHDPERSLELVLALHRYAVTRMQSEIFRWAEASVDAAGPRSRLRPCALATVAEGALQRGDLEAADAAARAALAADARPHAAALHASAEIALQRGQIDRAAVLFRGAHERAMAAGVQWQAIRSLGTLTLALVYGDRLDEARQHLSQVAALARASRNVATPAWVEFIEGELLAATDVEAAALHLERAVELAAAAGNRGLAGYAETAVASLQARRLDTLPALAHYATAIVRWQQAGAWTPQCVTLRNLVRLLATVGQLGDAALLYGAATSPRSAPPLYGADEEALRATARHLRARMGAQAFETAAAHGTALPADDVISLALDAVGRAQRAAVGGRGRS